VKTIIAALAFFISLSVTSDLGAQKLYTWTDDQGVIHITDDPPPKNARVEDVTAYPTKSPQEIDAIERKKQQLRENFKQFEEREAARRATVEAQKAQERAREAMQKAQEEAQQNQEYVRRLSSTQEKRRQFRKKIKRIKNETEAALTEAETAEKEAEAAVKKAEQASAEENDGQ